MSALGQKRTYALHQPMSALPPIATTKADSRKPPCLLYIRKRTCAAQLAMSALGQKRTHAAQQERSLFDQLVGELLEMQRHVEAECLCGLEVDHKLELGRCLYRKVAGLFTPKDTIDVTGRAPIIIDHVIPVGYQAAVGDEEAKSVDRRQVVARRQRDD